MGAKQTHLDVAHHSVAALREALRNDRTQLEQSYMQHGRVTRLLAAHTRLIDQYLRRVWDALALPDNIALVAVGGYGRGELSPKSDIDLLILLEYEAGEALQLKLSELVAQLWDIGLEVGHSMRTINECLDESHDITVQTNLLEARLVTGNAKLFGAMQTAMQNQLDPRAFYLAKLKEQQQRHARFIDADFNLEPNLKESPGGLRDLQTITWISRAAGLERPGSRGSDQHQRGAPDRPPRRAAENLARPFALLGEAARRPFDVRFPDAARRTDGHRRFNASPRQRTFDATLLPDTSCGTPVQYHPAAKSARLLVPRDFTATRLERTLPRDRHAARYTRRAFVRAHPRRDL
jgi:predicted nucleotidyltransferase